MSVQGKRAVLMAAALIALSASSRSLSVFSQSATPKSPAQHAADLFRQAKQLLTQGDLPVAQKEALEGLQLDPKSAAGYNLLGLIYGQEKDYAHAIGSFKAGLKLEPGSVELHTNLGNIYLVQGNGSLAEKEFRAALSHDATSRAANYNLGLVLMAEHLPKEAIRYFLRVRPSDPSTLLNLSQAYLQAGDTRQGLDTAQRLSQRGESDVRLHFTLGVMLAANHQLKAAERELERADALQPGTFEILFNLSQAYLENGDTAKAEATLLRALRLRPDSPETMYLLAKTYSEEHRDLDALELLVKAHKREPRNTDVIFLMARLSMKQSYYEDAIPLLESGLKIAPDRPDLHAALGESYFMAGKVEQAIQEFQRLIQLSPRAPSYAFMALCYRHLGRFDEAKKYLQAGLKDDPHNPACLYNMGYIANRQGNYQEAEQWLEKALQADPNYYDAMLELASSKMDQKKYAEAIPLLRKCTHLNPNPAAVYYKLAIAERNLHQTTAAENDFKVFQTLSKNPGSSPYPYQHLFDYLDQRAAFAPQQVAENDLLQLQRQVKLHPELPENLYLLAETYLKLGRPEDAEKTIAQLEQLSQGDFRTEVGIGVLLARYHLYAEAIRHFQSALQSNASSDDGWYDLADAYFDARDYERALEAIQHVSASGQNDASTLSLLGDIDAHLGRTEDAAQVFQHLIKENPDSDKSYLSLALVRLSSGDGQEAREALAEGLAHTPDSGALFWGMGVLAAVEGQPQQAEMFLKRAVDLLPQWPASYSALGVLYYQMGEIDKAREVLKEFTQNGPRGALNVERIEQALAAAAEQKSSPQEPFTLSPGARQQFLQMALLFADQKP